MSAAAGPSMSAADGLLALAEEAERRRDFSTAAACLESALSPAHAASLLPLAEARARLRLAGLLLARSRGLATAKAHLERALLVLNPLPSAPPRLKLLAHSLLANVYGLLGSVPSQKHVLRRGLGLLASASASGLLPAGPSLLWTSNFHAQLASAFAAEGDAASALSTLSEDRDPLTLSQVLQGDVDDSSPFVRIVRQHGSAAKSCKHSAHLEISLELDQIFMFLMEVVC